MKLGFHVRGCRNDTNTSLLIAVLFEPFIFHSEIPASVHVTLNTTTHQPCAALSQCTQDVSFSYSMSRNSANRDRDFMFRKPNFWCADLCRETGCSSSVRLTGITNITLIHHLAEGKQQKEWGYTSTPPTRPHGMKMEYHVHSHVCNTKFHKPNSSETTGYRQ
jgi:hypothetical protein